MIYYGFCGQKFEHELHVIYQGARNIAGAGTHWCIGHTHADALEEAKREN